MKFLCIACDQAMRLSEAAGPDAGSLTVTFACPTCGHRVAMLTNPWETQLVRTLGVKVGGMPAPDPRPIRRRAGGPRASTRRRARPGRPRPRRGDRRRRGRRVRHRTSGGRPGLSVRRDDRGNGDGSG